MKSVLSILLENSYNVTQFVTSDYLYVPLCEIFSYTTFPTICVELPLR